jgi:hypothetical protein
MTAKSPKVGQWLHASCSDEYFGQVKRVYVDVNGAPVIDIELVDVNEAVHFDDFDKMKNPVSRLQLPAGVKATLVEVQYEANSNDGVIVCNTPEGGCYRCCRLFTLNDYPYKDRHQMYDDAASRRAAAAGRPS